MERVNIFKSIVLLCASCLSVSGCITYHATGDSSLRRWGATEIASTFPVGRASLADVETKLGVCPDAFDTTSGPARPDGTFNLATRNCRWTYSRSFKSNCGSMELYFGPCLRMPQPDLYAILMRFNAQTGFLEETAINTRDSRTMLSITTTINSTGSRTTQFRLWKR